MTITVRAWTTKPVNYMFATTDPGTSPPSSGMSGFAPFTSVQQTQALQAMAVMSNVSGLTFTQGSGQIVFSNWTAGNSYSGWAWFPDTHHWAGDVWINPTYTSYSLILHEIGHAVGLDHSTNSVMEPTGQLGYLTYDDVLALHLLYGPSSTTLTSKTGTASGDVLVLNNLGNDIKGMAGNDTVYGMAGNDTLNGNADHDQVWGYSGNDQLFGGAGDDVLHGGDGTDTLRGDLGNDLLYGDAGSDVYRYTGDGYDWIVGWNTGDKVDLGGASYTLTEHQGQALVTLATGNIGFAGVSISQLGNWLI